MGDEEWFCAAAVEAGGAGDGFELFELAGAKPVEVGGHPLLFLVSTAGFCDDDARTRLVFQDSIYSVRIRGVQTRRWG